jgi:hypothetical protein
VLEYDLVVFNFLRSSYRSAIFAAILIIRGEDESTIRRFGPAKVQVAAR